MDGHVNANPVSAHCALYDLKEIGERSPMLFTDHQSRDELNGFEQNSLNGMLLHSLAGWDAVIPESMANYVRGVQTFRRACNPKLEMRKWMQEGMAGGISPWMHFIGARQEDRRQFENGRPLLDWHSRNEDALYHRTPVANVGLVWSQRNVSFYGQDESQTLCAEPWRGFTRALTRARIPALPLHADHIARYAPGLAVLILPELAVMSDEQIRMVEDFVRRGGSVVYTGATGMLDEWGEARSRFPLDELFGIRRRDAAPLREQRRASESWEPSMPCTPTCASRRRTTRSCAGLRTRTSCPLAGSSTRSPPTGSRRWRPSFPPSRSTRRRPASWTRSGWTAAAP